MSITARQEPQAPGCFGFAIAFDPDTPTCKACPFMSKCQPLAYQNLQVASATVSVQDLTRKHVTFGGAIIKKGDDDRMGQKLTARFELTPSQKRVVESLPPRARGIVKGIYETLGDVHTAMSSGVNPFVGYLPQYIEPFVDALMVGGIDRAQLRQIYREKYPSWTQATTETRCSMVITIFKKMGLIAQIDGKMRLVKCY